MITTFLCFELTNYDAQIKHNFTNIKTGERYHMPQGKQHSGGQTYFWRQALKRHGSNFGHDDDLDPFRVENDDI